MERIQMLRSDENAFAFQVENQPFSSHYYYAYPTVDLDHAAPAQTMLGFGASFTDASCYVISRLPPERKKALLEDLFLPDRMNLSIGRLNVGASDYSTEVYCYDDVPDDWKLEHFSIARDEAYLIPLLREIRAMRPDLYLFCAPWSPPGWMKTSNSMCGGYMRGKYLELFADYYVAYLKAYRDAGIVIDAASMQNEPDTDQLGRMPASILHPDFEMELIGRLMPPRLKAAGLSTKLWLYDHNYIGWRRVMGMLSDPDVLAHTDAVAFHPYEGNPEMIRPLREAFPEMPLQMTEKGPNHKKNAPEGKLMWWSHSIARALNCGCGSYCGWNYALDEKGAPNTGSYECAGLVAIPSGSDQIVPSVQYRAFRHYAPFLRRGSRRMVCPESSALPDTLDLVIFRNPDGGHVAVLGNRAAGNFSIQLQWHSRYLRVLLPAESLTTLCF
ncbi:MAG: glycoside hydrolase family 30 beta sandwich domain-containing protein [Victivallaceae bacterium]|nr:glycoside hydrolase family 30 beta sandwich domain-containing protein [Victivallaceae bacterium]